MIRASESTISMPRAKPTTIAATVISRIPETKAFTASSAGSLASTAATSPISRKPPAMSAIHQP